jgi:hypothetical protein
MMLTESRGELGRAPFPGRIVGLGHVARQGRDWDPASPGAEDVGEQIVVLTEPDDVGNQLLGRLSLTIRVGR